MRLGRRALLAGFAAMPLAARAESIGSHIGGIARLDPALDDVVAADSPIQVLGSGYGWAEGPVWVRQGGYLLFSDVPGNIVWRWREGRPPERFLDPSGHARPVPDGIREGGANGLAIDGDGRLLLADSGNRNLQRLDLQSGARTVLASHWQGKRFNSPNDLVVAKDGAIYFTDPPYGLADGDKSPLKELEFNGLFRLGPDGVLSLLDRSLHRPNGVALSPDGLTLYLALSDEARPEILAYVLGADGMPQGAPRLFRSFADEAKAKQPGLPDGLTTDREGRVYATGPGGVNVLTPDGKLLGRISTGFPIANCAFGEDGRTLFLTSWKLLARVRLKAAGW
ncbi:SMP-30/gluconolactonase/LRE family protein [Sandaracinobacter neustonicus]|uniref:SMP-30/gluconolactonase/LRE family protein n=1 Tax=Sandaracinobacter neustonicus TaxID=1715348 RepID=A0A501XIW9_9SPHN|nr:SMP-30/gluconolactonase/LRE family protein [Sandaracinobacter neustonicus]TPE60601.1 SMP-30/gluconolactonase/LRE family protein [Sandaracinobacter neustonicus]